MKLLISVIIPTANRPKYLLRAIESTLEGVASYDVEVIVVPNGTDQSWRDVLGAFKYNSSVKVFPIEEANANTARNVGLNNARGDYIRFLDDDDYLYPRGALAQYDLMAGSDADIVSGSVQIVNSLDEDVRVWLQPEVVDYCVGVLSPKRCCQPTAHLFRREFIKDLMWDPMVEIGQDISWMITICLNREVRWLTTPIIVGAWVQHSGVRVSKSKCLHDINKLNASMLIEAFDALLNQERLNSARRKALAEGLWGRVHSAYFLDPIYWQGIAGFALKVDAKARPIQDVYGYYLLRLLSPLLIIKGLKIKHLLVYKITRLFGLKK